MKNPDIHNKKTIRVDHPQAPFSTARNATVAVDAVDMNADLAGPAQLNFKRVEGTQIALDRIKGSGLDDVLIEHLTSGDELPHLSESVHAASVTREQLDKLLSQAQAELTDLRNPKILLTRGRIENFRKSLAEIRRGLSTVFIKTRDPEARPIIAMPYHFTQMPTEEIQELDPFKDFETNDSFLREADKLQESFSNISNSIETGVYGVVVVTRAGLAQYDAHALEADEMLSYAHLAGNHESPEASRHYNDVVQNLVWLSDSRLGFLNQVCAPSYNVLLNHIPSEKIEERRILHERRYQRGEEQLAASNGHGQEEVARRIQEMQFHDSQRKNLFTALQVKHLIGSRYQEGPYLPGMETPLLPAVEEDEIT